MREIKIKYYFKDRENKIHILTESIEEIESHNDIPVNIKNGWELIARCIYTNLTDKNNIEIYEEDIVTNGIDKGYVFWHTGRAMFCVDNSITDIAPMDDWDTFEVIGNINTKLLK